MMRFASSVHFCKGQHCGKWCEFLLQDNTRFNFKPRVTNAILKRFPDSTITRQSANIPYLFLCISKSVCVPKKEKSWSHSGYKEKKLFLLPSLKDLVCNNLSNSTQIALNDCCKDHLDRQVTGPNYDYCVWRFCKYFIFIEYNTLKTFFF